MMRTLISWNVNGLRAVARKGFLPWVAESSPDILCLQETKAHPGQLAAELTNIEGYHASFAYPERPGYSGVALFSREEPQRVETSLPGASTADEGRVLIATYPWARLYTIYFPNGKQSPERLAYKLAFYEDFLSAVKTDMEAGRHVVVCGDVNTAHTALDIARPKENEQVSGFLPEERAWLDRFAEAGLVDTFRLFTPDGGNYTWWDYKTRARERNVGWRIDYFYVDTPLAGRVRASDILGDVYGSDHCPIRLILDI
jgi:exodeoxyribonuclease-3